MSDARAATDGLREALSAVIGGGYFDGSLTADDILRAIEAAGWQVVPKERPLPRHLPRDAGSGAPAMTDPIKAALEAGARHMAQVPNPDRADVQQAGAAIAPFLRALNVNSPACQNMGMAPGFMWMERLAAAVEAAGRADG